MLSTEKVCDLAFFQVLVTFDLLRRLNTCYDVRIVPSASFFAKIHFVPFTSAPFFFL